MREFAKRPEVPMRQPEPPREAAPKPAGARPQPIDAAVLHRAETALMEALGDRAFETQRIGLYIAGSETERLHVVVAILTALPHIQQEIKLRTPAFMERSVFFLEFAKEVWRRVGHRILDDIHGACMKEWAFRKKVDQAQGKKPEEEEK